MKMILLVILANIIVNYRVHRPPRRALFASYGAALLLFYDNIYHCQ